jgi:hypothetical protein
MRTIRFLLVLCVLMLVTDNNAPTIPAPPSMHWKRYLRYTDPYQWDNNAESGIGGFDLWPPGYQWRI